MKNLSSRSAVTIGLLCAGMAVFGARSTAFAQMGGSMTPTPSAPRAAAAQKSKVSKTVTSQLMDAQKSMEAKDYQGALAKLKEAQAVADLTPFDNYIIDRLMAAADQGLNDMAGASNAVLAAADTGVVPDDDKKAVFHDALQASAFLQQWPKTIAYGQQLVQLNALDATTAANLAIAYYNTNDFTHAQQSAQQSIEFSKAAGQPPDQNAMKIVMSSQVKQNNQAGAEQTLEQLAMQNNSPESWAQLVAVSFGAKGMSDLGALYLYRLLVLTSGMKPEDYKVMGSLASQLGYPTEAAKVLEQGGQGGATLTKARHDAAMDERALPQIAASAEKSRTGEQDVKLGEDYWGYGRYADAEAAARRAIGKGGLKVPSEGPMLVGAAQAAQGKYAEAIQTLSQVTGSEANTKTAHLWSLYAQAKQRSASATPAGQSLTH
jgi:tetratricopeptide (TPR) repeat protein